MKKINLSQPVKVKLNERGKRIYKDRWGYNTQDGNGYTEMSLYSLMDFDSVLTAEKKPLFFEMDLAIITSF